MDLIEKNIGISEEFVFDEPQKKKSSIVRSVLDFIDKIEDSYNIILKDEDVHRLRKSIYKDLDSLHVLILKKCQQV